MSATEIILLLLGIIIFIASFVIPEKKGKLNEEDKKLSEEVIREILSHELDGTRSKIQDIVDESVSDTLEKTERTLDRLTNEKMLAVNEYSDTVLEEINKNHKEVLFLYNMLNDKQEDLRNAVRLIQKVQKEAELVIVDVKEVLKSTAKPVEQKETSKQSAEVGGKNTFVKAETSKKTTVPKKAPSVKQMPALVGGENGKNNNEKILKLHKEGKSKMSIAKDLGLGLGEVKLVIDLYEGM